MPSLVRRFLAEGHLIDSGLLTRILNLIVDSGADYQIMNFHMGKIRTDPSSVELEVRCAGEQQLASLTSLLVAQGCYEKAVGEALLRPAVKDSCVPDDFYATTNRRTQVFLRGAWRAQFPAWRGSSSARSGTAGRLSSWPGLWSSIPAAVPLLPPW